MTTLVDAPPDEVPGSGRPRRRVVLWTSLALAAVLCALIAVLATSSSSTEQLTQSPVVGRPAPSVVGPDQHGTTVSLSSYRGRWVLVNFAASWCQPCQEETPQLLLFASRHRGAAAPAIVTIEYDQSDLQGLRTFLASRGATWPVLDDPSAFVEYGGEGLPESYLVDPLGTVVAKVTGGVNADKLDQFIAGYALPAGAQ